MYACVCESNNNKGKLIRIVCLVVSLCFLDVKESQSSVFVVDEYLRLDKLIQKRFIFGGSVFHKALPHKHAHRRRLPHLCDAVALKRFKDFKEMLLQDIREGVYLPDVLLPRKPRRRNVLYPCCRRAPCQP